MSWKMTREQKESMYRKIFDQTVEKISSDKLGEVYNEVFPVLADAMHKQGFVDNALSTQVVLTFFMLINLNTDEIISALNKEPDKVLDFLETNLIKTTEKHIDVLRSCRFSNSNSTADELLRVRKEADRSTKH